jgi:hypothetical protein
MAMNRLVRRLAAVAAIAALAFAQLAVAAYACTGERPQMEATQSAMPCEMPSSNLCDRHCDYGANATDAQPVPSLPAITLFALPQRIVAIAPAAPSKAVARPFERSIERPPLIRFSVLRI